ncbi:MAG: hypothetical protein NWE93_15000 [Candidatus Bathyarchaeota archaeon]|nr:hypothetical protein [Candidatus Bathyarchaeota archaeon]
MPKVVNAYLMGDPSLTISGKTFYFEDISIFRIFCHDDSNNDSREKSIVFYMNNENHRVKTLNSYYLPVKTLKMIGKEVTEQFIGDYAYGEKSKSNQTKIQIKKDDFINIKRIDELKTISHHKFDLTRLIKLCEELNDNFISGNYLTVGMIGRTIINHVPPIFGLNTFDEVANNYGEMQKNTSFKKLMQNLNRTLRNIADGYLHQTIRPSETLPNLTQIDFRKEMDVLLEEVVRLLKRSTTA